MEETTAILNQTKTPFWSLGGRRRERDEAEDAVETTPEVSSKLGSLMQQLDAGIAQSTERERATQTGRKRDLHPVVDPAAEAPVIKAALEAAKVATVKAETAKIEIVKSEPAKAEIPKVELGVVERDASQPEAVEIDPATSEALRIIADQRKAAEALLSETRALEDQIKNAAVAAQAARAYQAAKTKADAAMAKVEAAGAAEDEAKQRSEALVHDLSVLAGELKGIEGIVAEKRHEADVAKAEIAELERKLGEMQRTVQTVFSDLALHESRARECSARETAAARSAAEAAARTAARKAEREAAEAAASEAHERAELLKAALPTAEDTGAIEDLQRLTARITEQVQLARNLRNGSLNGQKAS